MIVKIERKYKMFNDYFLEADDQKNSSVSSSTYVIKPHKKRGEDYTAIEPEPEDDETPSPEPEVLVDDEDDGGGYDEDPTDDISTDDNEDDVAVLDDGDEESEDYTSTDAVDDGDNNGENESEDKKEQPAISEAHRKFYLYQKFVSMYNYINKYINKLQVTTYNDIYYTSIIKLVLNKLSLLKKSLYEYLMIKFDKVSYVEAYVFYETCFNVMNMSIKLLENTVDNLKQ